MNTPHPFELVIGLDRSDRKADLHLIQTDTGQTDDQTLDTSPENLHAWLAQLRQHYPQARVAICLEQPAANLIAFLETYSWITLYPINPINPITLQKFREAFVPSRAKDDHQDARYLGELLWTHHDKLKPWQPADEGCGHQIAVRALAYKWQRIIWKCWQARRPYKEQIYEAALKQNGSALAGLLDQIELGKSPVKNRPNKS